MEMAFCIVLITLILMNIEEVVDYKINRRLAKR